MTIQPYIKLNNAWTQWDRGMDDVPGISFINNLVDLVAIGALTVTGHHANDPDLSPHAVYLLHKNSGKCFALLFPLIGQVIAASAGEGDQEIAYALVYKKLNNLRKVAHHLRNDDAFMRRLMDNKLLSHVSNWEYIGRNLLVNVNFMRDLILSFRIEGLPEGWEKFAEFVIEQLPPRQALALLKGVWQEVKTDRRAPTLGCPSSPRHFEKIERIIQESILSTIETIHDPIATQENVEFLCSFYRKKTSEFLDHVQPLLPSFDALSLLLHMYKYAHVRNGMFAGFYIVSANNLFSLVESEAFSRLVIECTKDFNSTLHSIHYHIVLAHCLEGGHTHEALEHPHAIQRSTQRCIDCILAYHTPLKAASLLAVLGLAYPATMGPILKAVRPRIEDKEFRSIIFEGLRNNPSVASHIYDLYRGYDEVLLDLCRAMIQSPSSYMNPTMHEIDLTAIRLGVRLAKHQMWGNASLEQEALCLAGEGAIDILGGSIPNKDLLYMLQRPPHSLPLQTTINNTRVDHPPHNLRMSKILQTMSQQGTLPKTIKLPIPSLYRLSLEVCRLTMMAYDASGMPTQTLQVIEPFSEFVDRIMAPLPLSAAAQDLANAAKTIVTTEFISPAHKAKAILPICEAVHSYIIGSRAFRVHFFAGWPSDLNIAEHVHKTYRNNDDVLLDLCRAINVRHMPEGYSDDIYLTAIKLGVKHASLIYLREKINLLPQALRIAGEGAVDHFFNPSAFLSYPFQSFLEKNATVIQEAITLTHAEDSPCHFRISKLLQAMSQCGTLPTCLSRPIPSLRRLCIEASRVAYMAYDQSGMPTQTLQVIESAVTDTDPKSMTS